jgi:hypothetical protein
VFEFIDDQLAVALRGWHVNGRMLGHGDPIRVRAGEHVLFHIVNGSATEIRSLALPGHMFEVIALDGKSVPTSAQAPVLWLGTAERVSAVAESSWRMGRALPCG